MFRPARNKIDLLDDEDAIDNALNEATVSGKSIKASKQDIKEILQDPPEEPELPINMLTGGVIKDIVDVAGLTGVGLVLTTIFSIIFSTVLFFWVMGRGGTGGISRAMIKQAIRLLAGIVVAEFIPVVQIVPATTLFILWVHNKDKKLFVFVGDIIKSISKSKKLSRYSN